MTAEAKTKAPLASEDRVLVSVQLQEWLDGESDKTLGSLVEVFGRKSFAIVFVILLGVPALPLPTGGATHVFEIISALLALELIVGRREIWLPKRWRGLALAGEKREKFIAGLMKLIRWLERFSRPRLASVLRNPAANVVFGLLVLAGAAGAFFAPPFSGLDTLPALGVVFLALGILLEDIIVVGVGVVMEFAGFVLVIALGRAVLTVLG